MMVAFNFYNIITDDRKKNEKLKEYISKASSALNFSPFHFIPDEIALKLKQLNPKDERDRLL